MQIERFSNSNQVVAADLSMVHHPMKGSSRIEKIVEIILAIMEEEHHEQGQK